MKQKVCSRCRVQQPLDCFVKSRDRKDGHNPWCKSCQKQYRDANKVKLLEKKREYHQRPEIREHYRKYKKRYYEENKEDLSARIRKYYEENRDVYLYNKAKQRCQEIGVEFSIDLEDVKIPEFCPYLGIKLTLKLGEGQLSSNASIDRINPNKGYVKGNVQVISRKANTMKSNATQEELVKFAKAILRDT